MKAGIILKLELAMLLLSGVAVIFLLGKLVLIKKIPLERLLSARPKSVLCRKCNIILVSIDMLRADELPCYGYFRNTAPNLCAFADKHVVFSKTYSQSSFTLDSHFSIMTSLLPSVHQVITTFRDTLSPSITTLAQVFKREGYATTIVVPPQEPALPLDKGLERGFDAIFPNDVEISGWKDGLSKFTEDVRQKKPAFVFLHTYYVHDPYLPGQKKLQFTTDNFPGIALSRQQFSQFTAEVWNIAIGQMRSRMLASDTDESRRRNQEIYNKFKKAKNLEEAKAVFESLPEVERYGFTFAAYDQHLDRNNPQVIAYLRALYDERIFQLDQDLKGLLNLLSDPQIAQNTIVVITADHGEEFMEHGHLGHASNVSNVQTHVPLILSVPGLKPRRIDDLVQSIDIYPTLLGLVGIEPPSWVQGLNLTDLMLGKPNALRNQYLVSEHRGKTTRAIRDMRWKLYVHDQPATDKDNELYDLLIDPAEQHNVIAQHPEIVKRLSQALEAMLKKKPSFPPVESQFPAWIDAQKRKKIIEEGYF